MRILFHFFIVLILFASTVIAQISDKISKITVETVQPGRPLTIQVELVQSTILDRIEIAYRQFGERDFRQSEMSLMGNSAIITLPAEILLPPFLEYYFIISVRGSNKSETYPLENPEQQPLKIDLQEPRVTKNKLIILSPEQDEKISPDDVLISFSAAQYDSLIDRSKTKIYLDDIDMSSHVVRSEDLFVLKPENASIFLEGGIHRIRVELFDTSGKSFDTFNWNFSVTGMIEKKTIPEFSPWRYGSSLQLETRQENIARRTTPFNRATISANGNYNDFRMKGSLYITNEEKSNLQPQNRYFIGGESPWLKLGYGDSYPVFSDLIMNGKRVRGFIGSLNLGKFNLDVTSGKILRRVDGGAGEPFPDSNLVAKQHEDPTATFVFFDSTSVGKRWVKLFPGTFDRDLLVVRTIFGKRDESHLGFGFLKSSDDIHSIRYGIRPQENVVLNSDLLLTFDRRNIEINGQVAFSATNKDISGGTFTDNDIDRIFPDSSYSASTRDNIRLMRNIFSRIITVNQYLIPLAKANFPTLSYEGGVGLNYFNNNLRFNYLRHGEGYESFGQSFLRTDVIGYNISDRQRLLENQLFLSGGFERLEDNTAKTKATTTTSTTANISISYYPRINFPHVTLAYLLASNQNDRDRRDTNYSIDDKTNRVLVQLGKEFTYGARHNATLSISTSMRDDNTLRVQKLDTRNTSVSLSLISIFNIPLQTMVSITVNSSKFMSGGTSPGPKNLSYTTLFTNAQYNILRDKLRLNASISPTFGDIQRTLFNASAQYFFWNYLSAQTQLNLYFNNKSYDYINTNTDIVWNFIVRADI